MVIFNSKLLVYQRVPFLSLPAIKNLLFSVMMWSNSEVTTWLGYFFIAATEKIPESEGRLISCKRTLPISEGYKANVYSCTSIYYVYIYIWLYIYYMIIIYVYKNHVHGSSKQIDQPGGGKKGRCRVPHLQGLVVPVQGRSFDTWEAQPDLRLEHGDEEGMRTRNFLLWGISCHWEFLRLALKDDSHHCFVVY